MDGLAHLTHDAFARLYPDYGALFRRMYDATVIGRTLQRESFGFRTIVTMQIGTAVPVASNTSREDALLVYLEFSGFATFYVLSSSQGGGGITLTAANIVATPVQQFVLKPAEELFLTQRFGPPQNVRVGTEYFR